MIMPLHSSRSPLQVGGSDRVVVDAALHNASVAQAYGLMGHGSNGFIVGDDHGGAAVGAVDVLQHAQDLPGGFVVQGTGGLIAR